MRRNAHAEVSIPLGGSTAGAWDVEQCVGIARQAVEQVSNEVPDLDPRLLTPQLLLRLYRQMEPMSTELHLLVHDELRALVAESARGRCSSMSVPVDLTLTQLRLGRAAPEIARRIHEHCHYLGSFRSGEHLALRTELSADAPIVALATLSSLDVEPLMRFLPRGVEPANALVLARLVSHPAAPRNTLSFLLGRVRAWLNDQRPEIRLLLTYLDPNLGFSGTIYRASNWVPFCEEPKQAYQYLDGRYVTSRELRRRFGTDDFELLQSNLGDRISRSSIELRPMLVYGCQVRALPR